jgi:hypothetical protein
MKQIIKLILLSVISLYSTTYSCYSQDTITLKNGDEIKTKVLEVTSDQIKYKKWDNLDGPSYSTAKSEVFMIKYKNGSKDVFNNASSASNISNSGDKFIGNWFPKRGDRGGVKERLTISKAGQDCLINYSRIEDAGGGMYINDGSFKETGHIEGSNLVVNSFLKLSLLNDNTILLGGEEFIKSPSQKAKTNIDRTNFTPDKLCKEWHMYKVIDLFDNGETRTREMNEETKMGYTKYDCDTKTFTNHGMNKQPDGAYKESYVQNGTWELSNDHSTLTHTKSWNAPEKVESNEIINLTDNELVIIRTLTGRSDNLHSDKVFYTCDKKNFTQVNTPEVTTDISNSGSVIKIHEIGEKYGGGIIFYLDNSKEHGLIAAEFDQSTNIKWDNGEGFQVGANSETDGRSNTMIIINKLGTRGYYAAKICRDYNGGGFTDWFLPAFDQLNLLYLQNDIVGGFNGKYYWSSTESGNMGRAWNLLFRPQTPYNTQKIFECNVRAIRSF